MILMKPEGILKHHTSVERCRKYIFDCVAVGPAASVLVGPGLVRVIMRMKRWCLARRKNVRGWNIDGALMHPEESKMPTVQQVSRCTQVCLKGPGPARWRIWRLPYRSLININRASRWPIIWTSLLAEKHEVTVRIQPFIHSWQILFFFFFV